MCIVRCTSLKLIERLLEINKIAIFSLLVSLNLNWILGCMDTGDGFGVCRCDIVFL